MVTELAQILPYEGRKTKLKEHQITKDIIQTINKVHKAAEKDYDKISEKFWKGNVRQTAKAIFDFLKQNVAYRIETKHDQTVKMPSAILHHGYGDCKHYASFINGIVASLERKGYPITSSYVYGNSEDNTDNYHHVFAVVEDKETGQKYIADAIYNKFDYTPKYLKTKTVPMALSIVAGDVGKRRTKAERRANKQARKEASKANRKARKAERKKVRNMPKAERKAYKKEKRQAKREAVKEIRKGYKPVDISRHITMKIPNAISRNAFLGLVKLNAFRMASKLGKKCNDDNNFKKALFKEWFRIGGQEIKLRTAINQGINIWNSRHTPTVAHISGANGYVEQITAYQPLTWQMPFCNCKSLAEIEDTEDSIGLEGAEWAALLAAAAPIIIGTFSMLLKKSGVDTTETDYAMEEAAEEVIEQVNDKNEHPDDDVKDGEAEDEKKFEWTKLIPQFGVKAYNDPADGTATIEYTKTNMNDNGEVDGSTGNLKFDMAIEQAKQLYKENKTPVLIGTGLLVFLVLKNSKGKRRRR